jgi:hypothetical protein
VRGAPLIFFQTFLSSEDNIYDEIVMNIRQKGERLLIILLQGISNKGTSVKYVPHSLEIAVIMWYTIRKTVKGVLM